MVGNAAPNPEAKTVYTALAKDGGSAMPRLSASSPKYRKHRASDQAIITIGGQDIYLGPHGSKRSRDEYDRVVFEWLAAGSRYESSRIGVCGP